MIQVRLFDLFYWFFFLICAALHNVQLVWLNRVLAAIGNASSYIVCTWRFFSKQYVARVMIWRLQRSTRPENIPKPPRKRPFNLSISTVSFTLRSEKQLPLLAHVFVFILHTLTIPVAVMRIRYVHASSGYYKGLGTKQHSSYFCSFFLSFFNLFDKQGKHRKVIFFNSLVSYVSLKSFNRQQEDWKRAHLFCPTEWLFGQ